MIPFATMKQYLLNRVIFETMCRSDRVPFIYQYNSTPRLIFNSYSDKTQARVSSIVIHHPDKR